MKNERGSIAVLAFVTVMFILIILATLFYSMVEKSKAQVIEMEKLSDTLDGDMGEVYKERKSRQGIFVTLYSDGSLVFNNINKTAEGKSVTVQYGDISNINITDVTDIPWNENKANITSVNFENTISPTSTAMWFSGCDKITTISNINRLDTSKVTNMASMFEGCTSLTNCNISSFNTINVADMSSMFKGCTSLTSINLTGITTEKVTNMDFMFNNCSALTTLDLSKFNTSNVTLMQSMFNNCTNITTIYVGSNWDTTKVISSENMFLNCSKLTGGNSTIYTEENVDVTYAKVDAEGVPGYFTAK